MTVPKSTFLPLLALLVVQACGGTVEMPSHTSDEDTTTSSPPVVSDADADGQTIEQGDCNDHDPNVFFGAEERDDDGIDSDCDNFDNITISAASAVATFTPPEPAFWWAGYSLGIHDVTGDGQPDVLVGAPGAWGEDHGAVFVGVGGPELSAVFDFGFKMRGRNDIDGFGYTMDGGLDASGDGVPDLLVTGFNMQFEASYLLTEPAFPGWLGVNHSTAYVTSTGQGLDKDEMASTVLWPDTNGDGVAELITGFTVTDATDQLTLHESPHTGVLDWQEGQELAVLEGDVLWNLIRTTDMDGNGRPELVTTDYFASPVQVIVIDPEAQPVTQWVFEGGDFATTPFVQDAGDVTGDGRGDLAVSLHTSDQHGYEAAGAVYILNELPAAGNISDIVEVGIPITGGGALDWMGVSTLLVDVNQDGQDDAIVSAPMNSYLSIMPGRVHVFYGPITSARTASDADLVITGDELQSWFGSELAVGDINQDGVVDLVVAAEHAMQDGTAGGKVYVFDGRDLWGP